MNPNPDFQKAIHQEVAWKNPEMRTFAVALVRGALTCGSPHFTTDVVPDTMRGSGTGIAGSVVELLKSASVIEPVGHKSADGSWYAKRVKSSRPERNGAWLSCYQLTSAALAQAFLARHGAGVDQPMRQVDFFGDLTQPAAIPENIQNLELRIPFESSKHPESGGQPVSFQSVGHGLNAD